MKIERLFEASREFWRSSVEPALLQAEALLPLTHHRHPELELGSPLHLLLISAAYGCKLYEWSLTEKKRLYHQSIVIGHVNEYPTMHYFGNPRHTQSMVAYMF